MLAIQFFLHNHTVSYTAFLHNHTAKPSGHSCPTFTVHGVSWLHSYLQRLLSHPRSLNILQNILPAAPKSPLAIGSKLLLDQVRSCCGADELTLR